MTKTLNPFVTHHLQDKRKKTGKLYDIGNCKICLKEVHWATSKILAHNKICFNESKENTTTEEYITPVFCEQRQEIEVLNTLINTPIDFNNLSLKFDENLKNTNLFIETVIGLKLEISESKKQQNLAWAIDHAELDSFEYYKENDTQTYNSKDFAKEVLLSFRRGCGKYVFDCLLRLNDLNSKKDFQDKFLFQIHSLTSVKPVYERGENGKLAIFYFKLN